MQKAIKTAAKKQPEYKVLHQGSIALVKIPNKARKGTLHSDKRVTFYQFAVYVAGGGCINVFLHSDNALLVGEQVTCQVKVLEKVFADGRSYIYVDLFPVEAGTEVTNQLFIVPFSKIEAPDHWTVFKTDGAQGYGMVAFAGLADEFPSKSKPVVVEASLSASMVPSRIRQVVLPKVKAPKAPKPPEAPKAKPGGKTKTVGSLADLGQLLSA